MKLLLSGYYGFNNVGDEAVLEAIKQGFAKHDLSVVTALNRYTFFRALNRCDIFISGGGSLFQDITSKRSFLYYVSQIYLAKLLGKRVAVFAQGIGPLKNTINRRIAKWILNKVDLITVRDEDSLVEIGRLGVKKPPIFLTGDPSAILEIPSSEIAQKIMDQEGIEKNSKPLCAFAIRNLREVNELAKVCDHLSRKLNFHIVFLLFQPSKDLKPSSQVIKEMEEPANIVFRNLNPLEMLSLVSQMDFFIGMRLHSLIFAAMAKVPMVGISYDPKVSAFMNRIHQPHVAQSQIPSLIPIIENTWNNKELIKQDLEEERQKLYHEAIKNFEIFEKWINPLIVSLLDIQIDNVNMDEALTKLEDLIHSGKPHQIATPNPEMIVAAQADSELKQILNNSSLRLPDGESLVVVSGMLGKPLKERVTGIDFLQKTLKQGKYRVFLLGGEPGIVDKINGENIVGRENGYFANDEEIIAKIKATKPDILFVGIGMIKQEKWIAKYLNTLEVPVCMGVGGSFDVLSGKKKRAPTWIRQAKIEWLYRLFMEPWRWKRQLALIKFLWLVFKPKLKL